MIIELHNPEEDRAVGKLLRELKYSATRVENGSAIRNLESGWPDPDGMWGTVLAKPA